MPTNLPPDPDHGAPESVADEVTEVIDRTERVVRRTVDRGLDRVGLPNTQRLEELVRDGIGKLERTLPLPDPTEVLDHARRGKEWLERKVGPLGDQLDPIRERIEEQRERTRPTPSTDDAPVDEDDWSGVEWFLFLLFLEWLSNQQLALDFEVEGALWTFDEEDGSEGTFEVWNKTIFVPPAPFAARMGDPMMHGDPAAPGVGSHDVWIGGKPALRLCDSHVCTKATPVVHVASGFVSTYDKVEINGFPALRLGDYVDEGPHGLNPIVAGCSTVTVGPTAPPVECWTPRAERPMPLPDVLPFRWRKGELGHFEGKVVIGVDIGGPFTRVEGTVTAARLWAEETIVTDVPLGDTDADGIDEVLRVTTHSKAERVLGVSDVEIEVRAGKRSIEVTPKKVLPKPPKTDTTSEVIEEPS